MNVHWLTCNVIQPKIYYIYQMSLSVFDKRKHVIKAFHIYIARCCMTRSDMRYELTASEPTMLIFVMDKPMQKAMYVRTAETEQ